MTRPLPFTKAGLRRAIEAAREAGLRVTGIRPDGTLIVNEATEPIVDSASIGEAVSTSRWDDVQA
jgi:hypothetical protein